jgi:prevent-host-death family protein
MNFVSVRELKSRTSEILRAALGQDVIVTKHGKPIAVLRGIDASAFAFERVAAGFGAGRISEAGRPWGAAVRSEESAILRLPSSDLPPSNAEAEPELAAESGPESSWHPLKAVFWDFPELAEEEKLKSYIARARLNPSGDSLDWVLTRMLERGRVIEVKKLFGWDEIRAALPHLSLTPWARAKWRRMTEIYART